MDRGDEYRSGVVEDVRFTEGGAGNQWTTIDGVRYATWWDVRSVDWRIGDKVRFTAFREPLWSGQPDVDCARNIHKVVEDESMDRGDESKVAEEEKC